MRLALHTQSMVVYDRLATIEDPVMTGAGITHGL